MSDRPDNIDALWEAARDGELSDEQRRQFDAQLAEQPRLKTLWRRESEWLAMMADDEHDIPQRDESFTRRVLEAWDRQADDRSVIARVGYPFAAVGAAIAAAVVFAIALNQFVGGLAAPTGPTLADNAPSNHPLARLVSGFGDTAERVGDQPKRFVSGVADVRVDTLGIQTFFTAAPAVPTPTDYLQSYLASDESDR